MIMNNKGQSLVLFILLIPVMLLILVSVYEVGKLVLIKNELDDIGKLAVNYGVLKIDDENVINDVRELVLKNKSDIDKVEVSIVDNKLYVSLEDKIEDELLLIGKFNGLTLTSSYYGYMDEEKKIIRKGN